MSTKLEYEAWIANEIKKSRNELSRVREREVLQIPLPDYGTVVDEKYTTLPDFSRNMS